MTALIAIDGIFLPSNYFELEKPKIIMLRIPKTVMFGRIISPNFSFSRFLAAFSAQIRNVLAERLDQSRIDNLPVLVRFIHTRSAYVAQTSLYGYLKTRMGTQYRSIFEDDTFAGPLNLAKWQIYAACLSDLSVFAIATVVSGQDVDAEVAEQFAARCFSAAIDDTFDDCAIAGLADESLIEFLSRLKSVDWENAARMENAFTVSPEVLAVCAPVIDEFKELDREIVMNSIRFRWRDVREQFRKRVDSGSLLARWAEFDSSEKRVAS